MTDHHSTARDRALEFAQSIREYGFPHSGAIEHYGAAHVLTVDETCEVWTVGEGQLVALNPEGVRVLDATAAGVRKIAGRWLGGYATNVWRNVDAFNVAMPVR